MLQDVDAQRETEVDVFAGYVSELGQKYNIATPYNDMFLEIIKAIDDKNQRYKVTWQTRIVKILETIFWKNFIPK